jgi:hypothetical protein
MSEWLKPAHRVQLVDIPGYRRKDYPAHALRVTGYDRFFASWV